MERAKQQPQTPATSNPSQQSQSQGTTNNNNKQEIATNVKESKAKSPQENGTYKNVIYACLEVIVLLCVFWITFKTEVNETVTNILR